MTSRSVTQRFSRNVACPRISMNSSKTVPGSGRMIRWIRSLSVAYCQAAKNAATTNTVSVYGAILRSLERPRLRALARTGSLTGMDEEAMGSGDPEQSTDLEHLVLEV